MNTRSVSRVGSLVTLLIVALGAVLVVSNRQQVIDQWRLHNYTPPAVIAQLADNTTMQGRGRDLFYVSKPLVQTRDAFNHNCSTARDEQSIVLGCYTHQDIFIYDVTDERLSGVKEVTAAHEMLHAAYERLSPTEKHRINGLLDQQLKQTTDPRIIGLIDLYKKSESTELYNEMHSILGTELGDVLPELEEYYSQYFGDRQKIVAYSRQYEGVLSASKAKITELQERLKQLKTQVDTNNTQLEADQQKLQNESDQMDQLRRAGNISAYNARVPDYNNEVRSFNALVEVTKTLVAEYNALVQEHNAEAAAQSDLYHSLDSEYEPATAGQ